MPRNISNCNHLFPFFHELAFELRVVGLAAAAGTCFETGETLALIVVVGEVDIAPSFADPRNQTYRLSSPTAALAASASLTARRCVYLRQRHRGGHFFFDFGLLFLVWWGGNYTHTDQVTRLG